MLESPDDREEAIMLLTFAVRELTSELARFRRFSEQADTEVLPVIRTLDTIRPPRVATKLSWHENLRQKRVSLPAATIWSGAGLLLVELGRALLDGRIHW